MEIDGGEMLKILSASNAIPMSFPVDLASEFFPGNIAQLYARGNSVVAARSDGMAPIGIIDDINSKVFVSNSVNETSISPPVTGVMNSAGQLVTPIDLTVLLENPNIDPLSIVSQIDCELIARNGAIIYPAGTPLNFDLLGSGQPNAIKNILSMSYFVPNIPGDSSVLGSKRVTVWYQRGIYESDIVDLSSPLPLNANLFVNQRGQLSTKEPRINSPVVAIVLNPPSVIGGSLQFLWL